MNRLTIAARSSSLARIQAYEVGRRIKTHFPEVEIDYHFRTSLGDRNLDNALWKMPEKGVFTEDFREDLIAGKFDLVVHSWKDLPIETRNGTQIVATLPRADNRDLILIRKDRMAQVATRKTLVILSSSPRRAYNLESFFKNYFPIPLENVRFETVRGNIQTRIRKLMEGEADGLVLAKAAIDRLLGSCEPEFDADKKEVRGYVNRCHWMVLPLSENPAAAAQGALAIEVADTSTALIELLGRINDTETFAMVTRERQILSAYGGGCHQKIGVSVLSKSYGRITYLRGQADSGEMLNAVTLENGRTASSKQPREKLWPVTMDEADLFERVELHPAQPPSRFLWISKAAALPSSWTVGFDTVVWTAGLETWKKLARRGIWVHGSSEGLGESEHSRVETLVDQADIEWLKLTHEDGYISDGKDILAVYRLVPKPLAIKGFESKTHFFWKSGSAFQYALETTPAIRNADHSCGPGWTTQMIREKLGPDYPVAIYLNHAHWLKEVSE